MSTETPRMSAEQAHALIEGTIVRDTETDAIGEVEQSGAGYLAVRWTENLHYSRELRDYIASTSWDLLAQDFEGSVPLAIVAAPELDEPSMGHDGSAPRRPRFEPGVGWR